MRIRRCCCLGSGITRCHATIRFQPDTPCWADVGGSTAPFLPATANNMRIALGYDAYHDRLILRDSGFTTSRAIMALRLGECSASASPIETVWTATQHDDVVDLAGTPSGFLTKYVFCADFFGPGEDDQRIYGLTRYTSSGARMDVWSANKNADDFQFHLQNYEVGSFFQARPVIAFGDVYTARVESSVMRYQKNGTTIFSATDLSALPGSAPAGENFHKWVTVNDHHYVHSAGLFGGFGPHSGVDVVVIGPERNGKLTRSGSSHAVSIGHDPLTGALYVIWGTASSTGVALHSATRIRGAPGSLGLTSTTENVDLLDISQAGNGEPFGRPLNEWPLVSWNLPIPLNA